MNILENMTTELFSATVNDWAEDNLTNSPEPLGKSLDCGIYVIKNRVNGKVYVGSSKEMKRRLRVHKKNLLNEEHQNTYLQKSFNKHGVDNFEFFILEYCDVKVRIDMEQEWVCFYQSMDTEKGFNLITPNKQEISDSTKKKMSQSKRGKPIPREHRLAISKAKSVPILQYDLDGNFLREFENQFDASKFCGCSQQSISGAITGKQKISSGYIWRKKTKNYPIQIHIFFNVKRIQKINKRHPVLIFKDNKLYTECESVLAASKFLGINNSDLNKRIKTGRRAKGFLVIYKEVK